MIKSTETPGLDELDAVISKTPLRNAPINGYSGSVIANYYLSAASALLCCCSLISATTQRSTSRRGAHVGDWCHPRPVTCVGSKDNALPSSKASVYSSQSWADYQCGTQIRDTMCIESA